MVIIRSDIPISPWPILSGSRGHHPVPPYPSFNLPSPRKGTDLSPGHKLFVCTVAPSGQRRFHTPGGRHDYEDGHTAAILDRRLPYSSFARPLPREGCQPDLCALPLTLHMFSCFFDAQTPTVSGGTLAPGPRKGQAAGVAPHRGKYSCFGSHAESLKAENDRSNERNLHS